ncbi:2TM domain-containing protein [Winogradskyella bathintestinalis]|uniref:2TM domain-containing protein n=1 Tax=Winogradskyella bathintestinalis TaxID=3035208 RepID=A0ABT7ZWK7_9FLAO|nr:2TM domain-containing protein [Winogradskyella bathintestinalis]MDN3493395.1 2TM domain-containing protein [Winogradskyella bathintestinalis]
METRDSNLKFLKAKNKVEKLKRFYIHSVVYIVINCVITMVKLMTNLNNDETFREALFDFSIIISWLVWGIALALHGFLVFILPLIIGEDWEEQKIEQYMNEELQND